MLTFKNYDEAVVNYFRDLYEWSVYASPDNAFHAAGMAFDDKVPLPLISVYRSDFSLNPIRNTALFFRGRTLAISDEKIEKERILPLLFSYQMDLWGDNDSVVNQLFSELLFAVIEDPLIKVHHDGYEEIKESNLVLTEIQNNSDSIQYSTRGRLYRLTAIFQVMAYIAKIEERTRIYVVPQFFDFDGKKIE